jgi:hypothetical protein
MVQKVRQEFGTPDSGNSVGRWAVDELLRLRKGYFWHKNFGTIVSGKDHRLWLCNCAFTMSASAKDDSFISREGQNDA